MGTHAVRGVGIATALVAMALASGTLLGPRTASSIQPVMLRHDGAHSSGGVLSASEDLGLGRAAGKAPAAGPIAIHWQSSPEIVRAARQFRHNGLPIVRLWQSGQNLIAIGLNPHGVPGIYFTQRLKD